MRFFELRQKDVINICTCKSLGCIDDLDIDIKSGEVSAIIIPGPGRFCGLFGKDTEYIIPWKCIKQIGDDIILVEIKEEQCCKSI